MRCRSRDSTTSAAGCSSTAPASTPGAGADIMGHPLEALAWLAGTMAEAGEALPGGTVVTLGSMVQTRWIERATEIAVEVDGLGSARATIA